MTEQVLNGILRRVVFALNINNAQKMLGAEPAKIPVCVEACHLLFLGVWGIVMDHRHSIALTAIDEGYALLEGGCALPSSGAALLSRAGGAAGLPPMLLLLGMLETLNGGGSVSTTISSFLDKSSVAILLDVGDKVVVERVSGVVAGPVGCHEGIVQLGARYALLRY